MAKKNLFIVEGECEKIFLNHYKDRMKNLGRIVIENVLQNILDFSVTGNKWDNVYIIIDTDLSKAYNIDKLIQNCKSINSKNIYLLLQDKNFEDELCYSMNINLKRLNKIFSACSNSEFKSNFISCKIIKTKLCNLELNKLYCRGTYFKGLLPPIKKVVFLKGKDIYK